MLTGAMNRGPSRRIGVIGESGVGKSTLINALISERLQLLPQGGIGPLTALPVEVRYASTPYLKVWCLGIAPIESMLEARVRYAARCGDPLQIVDRRLVQLASLATTGSQFARVSADEIVAFLRACLEIGGSEPTSLVLADRIARVRQLLAPRRARNTDRNRS